MKNDMSFRALVGLVLALCLALNSALVLADEVPADEERVVASAPDEDPAWQLYQDAFVEIINEDRAAAVSLLDRLVREYPEHPAALLGQRTLRAIAAVERGMDRRAPSGEFAYVPESTTNLARAGLLTFQTLHGIVVGSQLCIIAECGTATLVVGVLGGGAGLGLSLYATTEGITPGHASLLNSGTAWGFWNGLTLANLVDARNTNAFVASMIIGQGAGMGTAALIWSNFAPTSGAVSMANSGAIWLTAITLLLHGVADFNASPEAVWTSLFAASNVGLLGGALLSTQYPMSRGRALLIDASGILGLLSGFATYVLINGDSFDGPSFSASGLAGTLIGLGAGTYFSREWDAPSAPSVDLFLVPTDQGAMVGLGGRF